MPHAPRSGPTDRWAPPSSSVQESRRTATVSNLGAPTLPAARCPTLLCHLQTTWRAGATHGSRSMAPQRSTVLQQRAAQPVPRRRSARAPISTGAPRVSACVSWWGGPLGRFAARCSAAYGSGRVMLMPGGREHMRARLRFSPPAARLQSSPPGTRTSAMAARAGGSTASSRVSRCLTDGRPPHGMLAARLSQLHVGQCCLHTVTEAFLLFLGLESRGDGGRGR
jgi:hypothetical protein